MQPLTPLASAEAGQTMTTTAFASHGLADAGETQEEAKAYQREAARLGMPLAAGDNLEVSELAGTHGGAPSGGSHRSGRPLRASEAVS